jgi:hypothetical protein
MENTELTTSSSSLDILPFDPAVGDELDRAGVAFGDLVETTGQAIANTQLRLDLNSAATAQALATTQVDVIAARETTYHDNGTINTQVDHTMKLPLINFIDPVFYEWSHVRLQGQYYAMEVATAAKAHSKRYTKQSRTGQAGLLVLFGGGRTSSRSSTTVIDRESTSARDTSVGRMRMNALLRPRTDVSVPKPTQVIQGPNISILQSEFTPDNTGGFLSARHMEIVIQFSSREGNPIPSKEFSIETNGLTWEYTGAHVTDADGNVSLSLTRSFVDAEADTTPTDFIVSARKGMVSNSVTVQM